MTLDFSVREIIEQKITELEKEYQKMQGLILTEDDLKCSLYNKLMQIPEVSQRIETQDKQICANSIHTEVSWYDNNNNLTIKPDITILEPEHLSILHRYCSNLRLPSKQFPRLPSKQFSFSGTAIIFELKFIRNKTGIRPTTFKGQIMKDYRKIQGLFARLDSQEMPNNVFCYFVIFNKTNITCRVFDRFIEEQNRQSNRYKFIYATGNVQFG